MTAVEAAVGAAIVASVLAVAVPAFVRELHASRLTEPVAGLQRLGTDVVAYAQGRPVLQAIPASAPQTPSAVPRGTLVVDPPGTWDTPTWTALGFRASPEGTPHAFAFAFDAPGPTRTTFVAQAHGDLDGNGVTSTFEIRGHATGDPAGAVLQPGMYVESEIE
jgi:type II secretory pathway pseudopilin PulG